MKRYVAFLISLVVMLLFSGCDYYSDDTVSITLPEPDSMDVVEYMAGISAKKNTARINYLRYELDTVADGQIHITLPETIRDETGAEFAIDAFGGPVGPSAPLQKFELIIHVQEGVMEEPIALTIDAGALPLDTRDWDEVQVCFLAENAVAEIPLESVAFLSDEPLVYKVYLKEEAQNGALSDASDSDKWYEPPKTDYCGGEKVTVRIKQPEDGIERSLTVTHEPVELVEVREEYMQYEFIMPYHDVRITIVDNED